MLVNWTYQYYIFHFNEEVSSADMTHTVFMHFFIESRLQIRGSKCLYWTISNVQRDWNSAFHMWPWISDDVVRCFLITGVQGWLEKPNSPSGLGAQPPVTPPQSHPISSTHLQRVSGTVVHTLSKLTYLELRPLGPCSSQSLPSLPDTLSHLAETPAITSFCHITR